MGWRSTKSPMAFADTHHHPDRQDDRRNHHPEVLCHSDRRDHGIEREDNVQQKNLDDDAGKGTPDAGRPVALLTFELVMNLMCALGDQEEAPQDQDQVAPRYLLAQDLKQRGRQLDDPGDRSQKRDAHEHGKPQPDPPRPALLVGRKLSGQDRYENDVIHTQNNLQHGQGEECNPDSRVRQPFHNVPQRK